MRMGCCSWWSLSRTDPYRVSDLGRGQRERSVLYAIDTENKYKAINLREQFFTFNHVSHNILIQATSEGSDTADFVNGNFSSETYYP